MTRKQMEEKVKELYSEWSERSLALYEKARKQGRIHPGLDGENNITAALDEEMKQRFQQLKKEYESGEG